MQTSTIWQEYLRRFWVQDKFIEPYHPNQNPFEREMASWKNDALKLQIDTNSDPKGWYRLLAHIGDIHNHRANAANQDFLPPNHRRNW